MKPQTTLKCKLHIILLVLKPQTLEHKSHLLQITLYQVEVEDEVCNKMQRILWVCMHAGALWLYDGCNPGSIRVSYGPLQKLYDGHNDCHGSIRVSVWAVAKSPDHLTIE